jgi:hypothetical protein
MPSTEGEATAAVNTTVKRLIDELTTQHDPADALLAITAVAVDLICLCARDGSEEFIAQILYDDILSDIPRRKAHYVNLRGQRPSPSQDHS